MESELVGRWRIVEADLRDRGHLDLVEPASIAIRGDGRGEIVFGALEAGLDLEYGRSTVFFTWAGFDEMDEVNGSGSAEPQDDGSLEIDFAHHLGDEAVIKAVRDNSSTACKTVWTDLTRMKPRASATIAAKLLAVFSQRRATRLKRLSFPKHCSMRARPR